MFNQSQKMKHLTVASLLAIMVNGCGGGDGSSSTTDTESLSKSVITIVPADGYIYESSMSCSNGDVATLGDDNLTFTIESLDPGTCEITGGHHILNGEKIPNDASLKVIVDSASDGDELYATPLTSLVVASVEEGESVDNARKKVASLMGLNPTNGEDVSKLLRADPTKLDQLSLSNDNNDFDSLKARSSIVSVYTMMEQFTNAGVDKGTMDRALNDIVEKGSDTSPREELNASVMIDAVDKTLNIDQYKNQFEKINDLLIAQEGKIRDQPKSNHGNLEDVIANTIKIADELEDETASSEVNNDIAQEFDDVVTMSSAKYAIVDTAQSKCYDSNNGSEISCAKSGYDADYNGNQPSYTLSSSANIVTDNVTSLMWTKSSDIDGDGVTTDAGDKLSYDDSVAYCTNLSLDGYDDWRLPDIKTLYSLILFSGEDPSNYKGTETDELVTFLDGSFDRAFGDQGADQRIIDGQYATATKYVSTTMTGDETMFGVNFIDGRIKGYPTNMRGEDKTFYVLCTRGAEDYGKNNFVDNSDKTITDTATGLMWEQDDSQSSDFEDAVGSCESSTTANHSDWRLPNVKEMQSIVDYSRSPDTTNSAAIDPIFNATSFANEEGVTDWGYYWSSTTHASYGGGGSGASYVSFGRALGNMNNTIMDVHGAGAQRSNAKQSADAGGASSDTDVSDGSIYYYHGPQGDILRIDNMFRCVRDADLSSSETTPEDETTSEVTDTATKASLSPGYVLFSTMGENDTRLIDSDGTAIKTWSSSYTAAGASYLSSTNTLLRAGLTTDAKNGTFSTGGAVGGIIEEFNSNGDVIWSFSLDSDEYTLHHDFKEIDSDTIIALTWELKTYNDREYWNEKVIIISKSSSSIIWEWSAMDDGNILPTSNSKTDFLHFNSVDYKDGKIIISAKEQNKLYQIDKSTKEITATYDAQGTLSGQHDASLLDNGNILLFNNNDSQSASKVIELDTEGNTVWEYSNDFFSDHISGAQRLENGNTLICSGTEGKFIEVSPDKEELWEYTNTFTTSSPRGEMKSVFKIRKYEEYN